MASPEVLFLPWVKSSDWHYSSGRALLRPSMDAAPPRMMTSTSMVTTGPFTRGAVRARSVSEDACAFVWKLVRCVCNMCVRNPLTIHSQSTHNPLTCLTIDIGCTTTQAYFVTSGAPRWLRTRQTKRLLQSTGVFVVFCVSRSLFRGRGSCRDHQNRCRRTRKGPSSWNG